MSFSLRFTILLNKIKKKNPAFLLRPITISIHEFIFMLCNIHMEYVNIFMLVMYVFSVNLAQILKRNNWSFNNLTFYSYGNAKATKINLFQIPPKWIIIRKVVFVLLLLLVLIQISSTAKRKYRKLLQLNRMSKVKQNKIIIIWVRIMALTKILYAYKVITAIKKIPVEYILIVINFFL